MLQQINLCRFQAGFMQLWPPLDSIHEQNWEKLMEIFTTVKKKCLLLFYKTM